MNQQVDADLAGSIRALLFDTFGTVVDWREGVAREVAAFLRQHDHPGDPHRFADDWRALYQPAMEMVRSFRRPFVRLDALHRENLVGVLEAWGLNSSALSPSELDDLTTAWHRLDPWPDSIPGLRRLRERYLIAPLSNGNIALLTNMAKRAGIPWDCILGAEVVQAYKPAREAYTKTADVLGLAPAQCMLVAAHNDDLAAAKNAGLRTALIIRPREHGPNQTTDLSPTGSWDFVASDLQALADLLLKGA